MPLAGDPDALLAAAEELAGAARALGALGEEIDAHGRSITTDWTGPAAPLALERIGGDAEDVRRAAEAVAGVVGPLRTCADELRAAQRDVALDEVQRDQTVPTPPGGQVLMESAAERALVANEAAARAFRGAAEALPGAPPATAPQAGGPGLGGVLAGAGNIAASLGNAALHHPASGLAVVGGAALAGVSAVGVVGGTAATATGVGSPVGVPLAGLSAAGVAAGVGLAGAGAIDLTQHALGDDRVTPFQVDQETGAEAATPPFDPPAEITGLTRHAEERAAAREGTGVSDEAMADAVANPTTAPEYDAERRTYRYKGVDATVVLNEQGRVVTTWAESSRGWRNP
jgi:hypothetical protein